MIDAADTANPESDSVSEDWGGPLASPKFLSSFMEGLLAFDCHSMVLTQCVDENPEVISGRGLIELKPGDFKLRMYADPGTSVSADLERSKGWKSGEPIPKSAFFTINVRDFNGDVWISDPFLPKRQGTETDSMLFTGSIPTLRYQQPCKDARPWMQLHFRQDLKITGNVQVTTYREAEGENAMQGFFFGVTKAAVGNYDIEMHRKAHDDPRHVFNIQLREGTRFPAAFETHVLEALRYTLSAPLDWCICQRVENNSRTVTLRPVQELEASTLFRQPVMSDFLPYARNFWSLFEAYLTHVERHNDEVHFHPLSMQLYPLIFSAGVDLSVYGLLLGVAVEGILKEEFGSLGMPSPEDLANVDQARKKIENLEIDSRLKNRILGSLGNIKSSRPGDKLNALEQSGQIRKDLIGAWRDLRNSSAHASLSTDVNAVTKMMSQCRAVMTLVHLLTLLAVGYEGDCLDYTADRGPKFIPVKRGVVPVAQ